MKKKKPAKVYYGKDLDLSLLQCYPYRRVYIRSDSPTATDMTSANRTRNGQNMDKTDYAKILDKKYGANR